MNLIQHSSMLHIKMFFIGLIYIGCLLPLQAFSPVTFSSQRINSIFGIGWRNPTCIFSGEEFSEQIFQDDDCEDLCGDLNDDFTSPKSNVVSGQTTISPPSKTVSVVSTRSKPRDYRSSNFLRRSSLKPSTDWGPQPEHCKPCNGEGTQSCRFCGGTTFLAGIGGETDALFTAGIGLTCPVCDEDGLTTCHECTGTGWIVSWTSSGTNTTVSML